MTYEPAQPGMAEELIQSGAALRTGRSVGRTIYVKVGRDEDSKEDLLIGMLDSPTLAKWLVDAFNQNAFTNGPHKIT